MSTRDNIIEKLKAIGRFIAHYAVIFYENHWNGDEDPTIVTDDDGITVIKNKRVIHTMRWSAVRKVVFYQRDLFTLELIYTGLVDEHDNFCSTDELMIGYHDFCKAADKKFPGFREVEGMFGWNAAGRFSNVDPLWLDVQLGAPLRMPDGYVTRVPDRPGRIHIPF